MGKPRSSSGPTLSSSSATKRKRKSISLEVKMEVIRRYERGERAVDIARDMDMSESTLRTIRINTDKIKASCESLSPESVTKMSRSRSGLMENMEKQLVMWMEEESKKHVSLTMSAIQTKAKVLYGKLSEERGELNAKAFSASHGWFDRFKRRNSMRNVKVSAERCATTQEGPSLGSKDTEDVPNLFRMIIDLIEDGGSRPTAGSTNNLNKMGHQIWQSKEDQRSEKPGLVCSNTAVLAGSDARAHLTLEQISLAFQLIERALDVLFRYDENRERSSRVASIINSSLSPYRELYDEKLRNLTQLSSTKFLNGHPIVSQVQSFPDFSIPSSLPQIIYSNSNNSYSSTNISAFTSIHH